MVQANIVTVSILFVILAGPLRGEVVETTAAGFLVRNTAAMNAPPANVYAALTDKVGGWWDPAHTFSHDARNLSLDARAVAASASGCRTAAAFSTCASFTHYPANCFG